MPKKGKVTIKKHETSAKITVRIVNDSINEDPEHFYVRLASKDAKLKKHRVTVVIDDDDAPAALGTKLTGTITYHVIQDSYRGNLELNSPGQEQWVSTMTLHVSLAQLGNGTWFDDGTGYWTFASNNKLWFRRGEGVDTVGNGYPFGCADDPFASHVYKEIQWYGSDYNEGPLLMQPNQYSVPDRYQAFLQLSDYHANGSGTPVLKVVANVRPNRSDERIADGAHVCDPGTVDQPNPIVHQGEGDSHLDAYETDAYEPLIPRTNAPDGLAAAYDGTSLNFSDSDIRESDYGNYNNTTGHYAYEDTYHYTVSGRLTLQ